MLQFPQTCSLFEFCFRIISSLPHHNLAFLFMPVRSDVALCCRQVLRVHFQWLIWLCASFDINESLQKKAKFRIWILQGILYLVHLIFDMSLLLQIYWIWYQGENQMGCPEISGLLIGEYTVISFGRDDMDLASFRRMILNLKKKKNNINQPFVTYWAKAKTSPIHSKLCLC